MTNPVFDGVENTSDVGIYCKPADKHYRERDDGFIGEVEWVEEDSGGD